MKRRRNLIIVIGALAAIIAVGIFSASRGKSSTLEVRTATVAYSKFETKLPETGTVQRPQTQTLAALVTGNIGSISMRAGDRIHAGQLLMTIVNPQLEANLASARSSAISASARARSAGETNAALPTQNRSQIVQAQASVVSARVALSQSEQDVASGSQSGLGYGGASAQEQRLAASANLSRAQTDLREAQRIADANRDLYANKAISKDTLDQSMARLDTSRVAADQARQQRAILESQLLRSATTLRDRVGAQRDALRQAEANLASARANARISKTGDVVAAQADAQRAGEDAQFAAAQLARTQIRAPFDGIVQNVASQTGDALRTLQPGDPVSVGQSLATLASTERFVVRTRVDEQDVASIAIGQPANVSGDALGGKTLPGHIIAISPIAQRSDDPSNTARQVVTTVTLDRTLPFLRDGMTVDVDLITLRLPRAIVVPSDAIRRDGKRAYVFVVRDGKAQRSDVVLGQANDVSTIVRRGLVVGDRVIVDKNPLVVANAKVSPLPQPSASPKT